MPGFAFIEKHGLRIGAVALLAYTCLAQTHPALPNASHKLEVTVTDENGIAVRSAVVLLSTASQINPRHCETDFAGHCTFTNLAVATFQLRVEKQGFYTAILQSLQPQAGAAVDVTLAHLQEVRSVINLSESPSPIDPAQVSSKEQISGLDIIDIPYPATNDYRNALARLLPVPNLFLFELATGKALPPLWLLLGAARRLRRPHWRLQSSRCQRRRQLAQFLTFSGYNRRAFTSRIHFLGKK